MSHYTAAASSIRASRGWLATLDEPIWSLLSHSYLSCFFGHHSYVRMADRDGHHEYGCLHLRYLDVMLNS
jgi:hypothetical protein